MEQFERLSHARQLAGHDTGSAAARAFGWVESTYLGHENGTRPLRQSVAEKYAKAFGVDTAWLMLGAGEPNYRGVNKKPLPDKIEYEREILLRVIVASFQCLVEIDQAEARSFAEAVIELAERQQAVPQAQRVRDLVRTLAVSAARLFSHLKAL